MFRHIVTPLTKRASTATTPNLKLSTPTQQPRLFLSSLQNQQPMSRTTPTASTVALKPIVKQPSSSSSSSSSSMTMTTQHWPFTLPKFLQPQEGTTYFQRTNQNSIINNAKTKSKPEGVIQALLYGIPDPEKYAIHEEMVPRRVKKVVHDVVFGVPEKDLRKRAVKKDEEGEGERVRMEDGPEQEWLDGVKEGNDAMFCLKNLGKLKE